MPRSQSTMTVIFSGTAGAKACSSSTVGVHPGAGLVGVPDVPGHGDGATVVEHADDDGGGLVALERGVDGQGETFGIPPGQDPPGQDPPEQGREAESYVQLGLAGTGPVAAVVEPLPEILAQVVPLAPRWRGPRPRRSGRRCRRGWPRRPTAPGRSFVPGRGEVNAFQSFFASDSILWEGASGVSCIWWCHNQDAGCRCAFPS